MDDFQAFDTLPRNGAGAPQAWHRFGENDNVGMLNLQTPESVARAASLIRKGAVFSLNAATDLFAPALTPQRGVPRHNKFSIEAPWVMVWDDVLDNFYPQAGSQWDSLSHVSTNTKQFYNDAPIEDIRAGTRNGIDHWARKGIAGRAVLLDLVDVAGPDYEPGSSHAFTVADLEMARTASGVEYQPGDVIILNTGFAQWYSGLGPFEKSTLVRDLKAPGVEHSEDIVRYFWSAQPAAIVSDTFSVEVFPPDHREEEPFGFIHEVLIGGFGIALGELWWLADLVADCRTDGVYEFFLTSAPLNIPGGAGSPANALAIK